MTWTKTSDDFPERMWDRSSDAYRLHHAATTFANRMLLDGRIRKSQRSMIPVPARVRRPQVIAELVAAGIWRDDGDAWTLTDFMTYQLTREEVGANREYDAARQRIRYAKTKEAKTALRPVEEAAKARLYAAREQHRALLSRCESQGESQGESRGDSQRPVPSRPVPSRPHEDEDERASPSSLAESLEAETPDLRIQAELAARGASFGEHMAAAGFNLPDDEPHQPDPKSAPGLIA